MPPDPRHTKRTLGLCFARPYCCQLNLRLSSYNNNTTPPLHSSSALLDNMASYHYGMPTYHQTTATHTQNHHGHHGRSRRGPRVSSQNAHRQYKAQRSPKEEAPQVQTYSEYLRVLEAARGFEFDDDEVFCPFNLLTEDDVSLRTPCHLRAPANIPLQLQSIHSSSASDRGSLSSGSPSGSPLQTQVQPTPSLLLPTLPQSYTPVNYHQAQSKLHQPMAQRTRNAIPIVDPSTRSASSVSPGRQVQQQYQRRW